MMKNKWFPNEEWFKDDEGGEDFPRKPRIPFKLSKPLWLILLLAVAVIVTLPAFADFYTELLWFRSRGLVQVFWKKLLPQWVLFGAAGITALLIYWFNFRKAFGNAIGLVNPDIRDFIGKRFPALLIPVISAIMALANGFSTRGEWAMVLRFLHKTPFGHSDPIFTRDVGFYVFSLPFFSFIQGWLLNVSILTLLGCCVIYVMALMPQIQQTGKISVPRKPQVHLTLAGSLIITLWAAGFWIQRYYLLYSPRGVAFGASYTDIHAELLALNVMTVLTLMVALLLLLSLFMKKTWKFSAGLVAMLLVTSIVIRGFYPGLIQKYVVEPNEFAKEKPYIENNIKATLDAYKLSDLETQVIVPDDEVVLSDLNSNFDTIHNIRLWDYRPLSRTYRQLQEIRSYYDFPDVDIDRYMFGDDYRQVILAARELDLQGLQNPTWVNTHLEFTHGYGIVMNPVNEVSASGLPVLWIKDIPPKLSVPLTIDRPEIYYGEKPNSYIFVKTTVKEFDYPMGESNARTTYTGNGGVSIGNIWRRLLFTMSFGDSKILFTNVFTPESKVMYHRNIRERLQHVAPFLMFDDDPYLAVIGDRLVWIVDAYTISDRYPYSEPVAISGSDSSEFRRINYVRNSVKATVDAYDGDMHFYIADESDPLIQTWSAIFPGLFSSMGEMPADMREHLRYPQGLFEVQSEIYRTYHMTNPNTFYNKEDVWEVTSHGDRQGRPDSYYMIMRLTGEESSEFVLISPFMPVGRDNMISWMAGRSDGENYGQLLVYRFPKQKLIYGPSQVEALTDQNPEISAQLSLWSQRGSDVIRGHLLVIPIENSILYVQPLYLRAETSDLPELKRVIVSTGGRVVWDTSLNGALMKLLGEGASLPEKDRIERQDRLPSYTGDEEISELALKAQDYWEAAQDALKDADWETYGREMKKLEDVIRKMAGSSTLEYAPDTEEEEPDENTDIQ
jgi:uncharacterized membrane protein (UPF0182 family)